jgi:diaminopimelate decarboxylase
VPAYRCAAGGDRHVDLPAFRAVTRHERVEQVEKDGQHEHRVSAPASGEARRCGDLVVVHQSGAYGWTASPVDFLGHPHPVELLL